MMVYGLGRIEYYMLRLVMSFGLIPHRQTRSRELAEPRAIVCATKNKIQDHLATTVGKLMLYRLGHIDYDTR